MELSITEKNELLKIARTSLESAVQHKPFPKVEITQKFQFPAGAFVTLKSGGELRGCIGTMIPVTSLFETIVNMARSAGLEDSRFHPVSPVELEAIDIEISVLTPLKTITSPEEFIIGKHGIIIRYQNRQAVFLPPVSYTHLTLPTIYSV